MKIDPKFVAQVRDAKTVKDLQGLVQQAIELEHATIPPYLCGFFTLRLGTNSEVADIIRSVVIEEMLHFTIASNLMIALGGQPAINTKKFVPEYPTGLPFGIGDQPGHEFDVRLRKCSIDQVENVFLKIEEPDKPLDIPVAPNGRLMAMADALPNEPVFDTIGDFYRFLKQKIRDMDQDGLITWHTDRQVVARKWFPDPDEMFLIDGVDAAARGIDVIVDQGEGTGHDPFDLDGEPAHFYRFQEIVKGRTLIRNPDLDPPFEFGGASVLLDTKNVWDMDDDPQVKKYQPGTPSHRIAAQFAYSYTRALNALHNAFNGGGVDLIDEAMGVMYELRLLAQQVLATPAVWADGTANPNGVATGLSFERVEVNT